MSNDDGLARTYEQRLRERMEDIEPMKRFTFEWKRHFRPAGGIFIGIKFHFPCSIWDGQPESETGFKPTNTTYKLAWVHIGLAIWTLDIQYRYGAKPL